MTSSTPSSRPTSRNSSTRSPRGAKPWTQVLRGFLRPVLRNAREGSEIEKAEIKDEVSDVVCEMQREHGLQAGRFGTFLARPTPPPTAGTPPQSSSAWTSHAPNAAPRSSGATFKNGRRVFYGCENYPACDFVAWDLPVNEKCPECGSYMVEKTAAQGKTRRQVYKCANKDRGHRMDKPAKNGRQGQGGCVTGNGCAL